MSKQAWLYHRSYDHFLAATVPVVTLVIAGGSQSIHIAHRIIMNQSPLVILAGSGGAADILAFAYQYAQSRDKVRYVQIKHIFVMSISTNSVCNNFLVGSFKTTKPACIIKFVNNENIELRSIR